jgi:hypothetical protein
MNMKNELKMLFERLQEIESKKHLVMDFNSVYGGYRIHIVLESTGEDFYSLSSRLSHREMVAHLRGILKGVEIVK